MSENGGNAAASPAEGSGAARGLIAILVVLAILLGALALLRGLETDTVEMADAPSAGDAETSAASGTEPETPATDVTGAQEEAVQATPEQVAPTAPEFDIVRVDRDGSAVVAGRASPGSTVKVIVDGQEIASAKANREGTFVAIMDLPTMETPEELQLSQQGENGALMTSDASVLVMPRPEKPPQVVVAGVDGARVLQGEGQMQTEAAPDPTPEEPAPAVLADLSLDTITYSESGDVVVGGRGSDDQFVRIYVDNQPVETRQIGEDGEWKVILDNVDEGLYTLRVDAVDESGEVTARVESPFKRERLGLLDLGDRVTVQPGYTLWFLAQSKYGEGLRYVQIFEANRDRIRNPDLIYPGQVFDLPN